MFDIIAIYMEMHSSQGDTYFVKRKYLKSSFTSGIYSYIVAAFCINGLSLVVCSVCIIK